ncbi:putative potassium voltage-gated channel subfamily G member 3-like [Scophthalmus maximus]|uniref:Putative potassium voltage-gated channel subfamily G member 3-like n=1 Tax=Scophthalmus maximus TaxID=52904 RepID=A0A2U9CDM8_SCOMX|nr:putative potassium voltage-gated channel subfamily G member 3-like [Scophthalmus maximus]
MSPASDASMTECLTASFTSFQRRGPRGPDETQSHWRESMRRTFEEPTSSLVAQILASVSVLFVVVSMVMLCASTLPDWMAAETLDQHK